MLALSGCTQLDTPPKYAKGVHVDCGGKQDLTGSGSTAQANAMSHFITSYEESCSGKQLTYSASGSGAGIEDFLAAKTDFGGSDSPLSGDEPRPRSSAAAARTRGTCRSSSVR